MDLSMFLTQQPAFVQQPQSVQLPVLPQLPADYCLLQPSQLPVQRLPLLPLLEQPRLVCERLRPRVEQRPLAVPRVSGVKTSNRKGRKAKTAAKHAAIAQKKSMTKQAKKPASKQCNPKRKGNGHFMFWQFAKSVTLQGNTRNLCNPRTVLAAEKAVARLKKALAKATA